MPKFVTLSFLFLYSRLSIFDWSVEDGLLHMEVGDV